MRHGVSVCAVLCCLVLAGCGGGGGAGAAGTVLAAPAAPEGVTLVASRESATLSWSPVESAAGYRVFLSTKAGLARPDLDTFDGMSRLVVDGTVTSVPFEDLAAGTTCYACVESFNDAGAALSPEVSAVLPPAAPIGLVVTAGDGAVALSWSASEGATSYAVFAARAARVDSASWSTLPGGAHFTSGAPELSVTGLSNDVEHAFVVVAVNEGGASPDSSVVAATPASPPEEPPVVEALKATDGPGAVTLTWADAQPDVTYVLYVATDPSVTSDSWESLPGGARYGGVTSPYTLAGLEPGTTIYFVVTAVRDGTEGGDSPVVHATPNARGTFTRFDTLAVGHLASDLVAADFDGDGTVDLATTNLADGTLSIVRIRQDGSLETVATIDVGETPRALCAGDFDGDGVVDLAVALEKSSTVVVLRGNGAFGFSESGSHDVVGGPSRLVALEADGDDVLDLAVCGADDDEVVVLRGDGDGGFERHASFATRAGPVAIAAGDLDRDSRTDLVVASFGGDSLSTVLGTDGGFASPRTLATGAKPTDVQLGDWNGDGTSDVVVTDAEDDLVECFLGKGDGTFEQPLPLDAGSRPSACVSADFDGDGHFDLVVANAGDASVSVFLGDGTGHFTPRQTLGDLPDGPRTLVVADFDGDGLLDVLVLSMEGGSVTLLLGAS